jgi:hypothetical protein
MQAKNKYSHSFVKISGDFLLVGPILNAESRSSQEQLLLGTSLVLNYLGSIYPVSGPLDQSTDEKKGESCQ